MLFFMLFGGCFGQVIDQIVCPAIRQDTNDANIASDLIWIDLLFNLDKHLSEGNRFIERDGPVGNDVLECLGASGHCLLIRIALGVMEVCSGFGYPQEITARVPRNRLQFDWYEVGFEHNLGFPIDIKFQYVESGTSILESRNHIRNKRLKNIHGIAWPQSSIADDRLQLRYELVDFNIDGVGEVIKRNLVRQATLDLVYPCAEVVRKAKVANVVSLMNEVKELLAETGDSKVAVDNKNFSSNFMADSSFTHSLLKPNLAVRGNDNAVLRDNNGGCCGIGSNRGSNQKDDQ